MSRLFLTSVLCAVCFLGSHRVRAQEGYRASYYKDGEIHVNVLGQPEGKPITTGHWDFKPSWSMTGDHLVFFRRLKNDPVVSNWITQLCIINADGTGFHPLSDGTYTDFNPTWTRDGKNTPVWNRKNGEKGGYHIMASRIGGKPGEEIALTDPSYSAWVHSAVRDGRLLVAASPPGLGRGYRPLRFEGDRWAGFVSTGGMRPQGTAAELEARRRRAVQLLDQGWRVQDVAAAVGASRKSVYLWKQAAGRHGARSRGLAAKPPYVRACRLSLRERARLKRLLTAGPRRAGFATDLWTLPRVPPYAPELNPTEHVWSTSKWGPLAGVPHPDLAHLRAGVAGELGRQAAQPRLLRAHFRWAGLELP